jgi:hypothetical protein
MITNTQKVEELLLEIFGGNPYHARCNRHEKDIYYSPIEVSLSLNDIHNHLEGNIILGSYQLLMGSDAVKWIGWDVDSTDITVARAIVLSIIKHLDRVPYSVEFSGGKGYHVLVFLDIPVPAFKAKKIVDAIREREGHSSIGDSHVECFPKQDKLSKARPKGSLLKIPLGIHARTERRSKFVDPFNGWEEGPEFDPILSLQSRASLDSLTVVSEAGPTAADQLIQLLTPFWKSGNRHEMALFLSGFLAHEGWGVDAVRELVAKIVVAAGDDDPYNRDETVNSTFQKLSEGKSVRGRQGLGEMLPVSAMQRLTELASSMRTPDTVAQIDEIRYTSGKSPLDNARLASNTIWSILNDEGSKLFQTDFNDAYWYNSKDFTVTQEGTEFWKSILNGMFGMNPCDSFSRLVTTELRLRIVREAPIIPVQNRSYWSDESAKLFINLGGPEVYILDGDEVEISHNGECGYMFITNENGKYMVPDFTAPRIDAWDYLVNDLSFTSSIEAPSQPEEQRELLKAWLLAFFFQELMPTKPILSMLGAAGSGKTTAIRRVLRIFENPDADVLGIPTDKQDAFRASIASHRLLVLDNLEKSGSWWMVDILNKLATGNNIELRELYKTNAKHTIIPRCFVACTAVNMPFSDETLFSRLLVLEMAQLQNPIAEHIIQRKIREFGPAIWADIMRKLNDVIVNLKKNRVVLPPTKSRLVDFNVFCARIRTSTAVDGEKLNLGLLSMVDAQLRQLKESSQAITFLEEWISIRPDEAEQWHTYQELYQYLQGIASAQRNDFKWRNAVALGRHLSTLRSRLEQDFNAEFDEKFSASTGKDMTKIRFRVRM